MVVDSSSHWLKLVVQYLASVLFFCFRVGPALRLLLVVVNTIRVLSLNQGSSTFMKLRATSGVPINAKGY